MLITYLKMVIGDKVKDQTSGLDNPLGFVYKITARGHCVENTAFLRVIQLQHLYC